MGRVANLGTLEKNVLSGFPEGNGTLAPVRGVHFFLRALSRAAPSYGF